ncbi:MAG TPA: MFS transporter [Caulobacteraceae bacterium]|jgi:MFS family permease
MSTIADAATLMPAAEPTDLPGRDRNRILVYLGFLVFVLGFGAPFGGLISLPVTFFLKNKLHLHASEVAQFVFVAGAPLYVGFLWGFVRDLWNPFGLRDRGYMIIFGVLCAAIYAYFAFVPLGTGASATTTLMIASILMTMAFLFVQSGQTGLAATVARQHVMSGQMSSVMNGVLSVATLIPFVAGGYLSDQLEGKNADQAAKTLFLVGAGVMAFMALFALWRPRVVYDNVHPEHDKQFHPLQDAKRLFSHWPVYPALGIWFLWNFAPGSATPLQFYLQNTLHATDSQWSWWQGLFAAGFIPTYALFGFLCRKMPLRRLLFWGTIVAVPQMLPLIFVNSVPISLVVALAAGLMGGVATAAYLDLLIRSCPKGLEGTILMASNALYYLVSRLGDILGTYLYDKFHGFLVCAVAITVVYALIVPALWLVPKRLTATADGEAPEGGFDA